MPISRIFEVEGEKGFRHREREFLRTMLIRDRCVLSCGGGIVTQEDNRELLKRLGTVIYLKVSADEAVSRILHPESRPLLFGETSPEELMKMRLPYYEETAEIVIDTNGLDVSQVTTAVQRALIKKGKLKPSERPDKSGRPDRPGNHKPSGRPDRPGNHKPSGRPEKSGRPDRSGNHQSSGRPNGSGGPDQSGNHKPSGSLDQKGNPRPSGRPEKPTGRSDEPRNPDNPVNPNQAGKPSQPSKPDQTGRS